MSTSTERTIFLRAIEEGTLEDRAAYLQTACGDDHQLRASVEALLNAHECETNLLDRPIVAAPVHLDAENLDKRNPATDDAIDHIGMRIGPYRLMEQIGEGGFGLVFVAQQESPVERKVALKIVKPGVGSKEVLARFEAERQAVAMMNHPNIAQVFDAGVTTDRRPYFVMELVRGLPITEFCDQQRLDVRQRLQLLCDVCSAVHHAHQKGVIHRDIKPSNVMVTLHDAKPIAKVIDFGIAKAIGQSLTDKTIYTRFFSMIGTPLYMSPEQAELSSLDIDTRSDIYSLGVLMYELLSGTTPFDRNRLNTAGLDELRRIIREEEPPRPSRRLTTLGEQKTTVSVARRVDPARLVSQLSGDLDWIAMKAIEKDRGRRYESAAAMGDDIQRYLTEQPILARPPTLAYQFSKFASRHRSAIATFGLILATMTLATVVSVWQMRVAMQQRDEKEAALREANQAKQKIQQFALNLSKANSLIASGQAHANAGRMEAARADFDAAVIQQPDYYQSWIARGQFLTRQELWREAAADYSQALQLGAPTQTPSWWAISTLFLLADRKSDYRQMCAGLDGRLENLDDAPQWELLRDCGASGQYAFSVSRSELAETAERWLQQMRPARPQRPLPPPPRRGPNVGRDKPPIQLPYEVCVYITGLSHLRAGNYQQAIDRLTEASQDPHWPAWDLPLSLLAIAYHRLGDAAQAERYFERADRQLIDEALRSLDDSTRPNTPWFDSVERKLYYAEAKQILSQ